jgi:hypothetical protein
MNSINVQKGFNLGNDLPKGVDNLSGLAYSEIEDRVKFSMWNIWSCLLWSGLDSER